MLTSRHINTDLADVICKKLRERKFRGSLAAIAQCSKFWNAIAVPHLYREIELDFSRASQYTARCCLDAIIANPFYSDYIHLLFVLRKPNHIHSLLHNIPLDLLRKLYIVVSLCHNLEEFQWGSRHPIPTHIIEALGRHERLSRVWILTCCGTREQFEALESLSGSSKVNAITVSIDWTRWSSLFPSLSTQEISERFQIDRALGFKKLITNMPKLQFLELNIDIPYFDFHQNTLLSRFLEFESFPRVSKLTLHGWSFAHVGPNTLQRRLDPSILQELRITAVLEIDQLFEVLVNHGTQLKRLSVQVASASRRHVRVPAGATRWPAFEAFLNQQKALEELFLVSCRVKMEVAVGCALTNKATLKKLGVHRHDRDPYDRSPCFKVSFSPTNLDKIRLDCEQLEMLAMDMPLEELIADSSLYVPILAKFPSLQSLGFKTQSNTQPFVAHYQTAPPVASLAAAVWCPTLQTFSLDIRDDKSKGSYNQGSTWRLWKVQGNTGSITPSASLEQFHVVECVEQEFEAWMKRMAKAKGQPYRGSGLSRDRKRKGWLKAVEYFETFKEEPGKSGTATTIVERVRAFARSMFKRWL